ncbi:MAG TPA: type II toxin-antitoxin system RelE/ParE family toxin, partial [Geminicoccaceae bacterium]|nr:type II toxin-antitoxin system RelE/ParE family toxin [Geminicoccaceae bacterium]
TRAPLSLHYERMVRKLLSATEREAMERAIAADPLAAPVIAGTGGIRKVRRAGSGRGKRGGVRTIYFFYGGAATVYLLTVYAKAEREDLTPADRKAWARLVETIKRERRR